MTANLLSRLQGLTAPDREVDALIHTAANPPLREGLRFGRVPAYTASLDATVALCERVLPGRQWAVWGGAIEAGSTKPRCMAHVSNGFRQWTADDCPTPAIALLIAILRGKLSSEDVADALGEADRIHDSEARDGTE